MDPANTESPRNGAQRIRNLGLALLAMLGQGGSGPVTFAGSLVTSIDGAGLPTFPGDAKVGSDPTSALSITPKQYVDAKTPYVVLSGGDAYAATYPDIPSLITGQYLQAKVNAANTTTTPTLNLNSTGPVPIVTVTGANPAIGALAVGGTYLMVYDGAVNVWVLTSLGNPTTGTFPLAADGDANSHKVINLAVATGVADALSALNFVGLGAQPGFFKIPIDVGGVFKTLIVQWGTVTPAGITAASFATTAVTFPAAFATSVYTVVTGPIAANDNGAFHCHTSVQNASVTVSGFTLQVGNDAASNTFSLGAYWIAVGQ